MCHAIGVFFHSCDVQCIWQLFLVLETCIPLSGVNFTFLYISFLYTLPVRLYHFNCLSEQDLLWIMGMINQIKIFSPLSPSQSWKRKQKYSPNIFHMVPVSMYESTEGNSKGWILGNLPYCTQCHDLEHDLWWWMNMWFISQFDI